jgi:SAM-dependent methyltransferase
MRLDDIYRNRFPEADRAAKTAVWRVLCRHFFQRYIGPADVVLDIGAGFGEFLSNIQCGRRIAVDVERLSGRQLPPGSDEILVASHELSSQVPAASVDVVFCSNVFEHLPNTAIFLATLAEIRQVLRPGGRLLVLQPNIRLVGGAYWDFVDHHLPLTERSLVEACESTGFRVTEVITRFLPYTTRSALPTAPWLVRLYLMCPPVWRLMGGQTFLVATPRP